MGKILFRTFIILAVAGAIAGGLYAWVSANGLPGWANGGRGGFEGRGGEQGAQIERPAPPDGGAAFDGGERPDFGGEGFGRRGEHGAVDLTRGLAGLGKNLGIVALVTALVALARWVFGWLRGLGKRRSAGAGA